MRRLFTTLLWLVFLFTLHGAKADSAKAGSVKVDSVKVIASIKPVQLIAAAILDGVSEPALLVPVGASPHGYAMRPSDLVRLREADVVFWVGPEMEPFLIKVLSNHRKGTVVRNFSDYESDQEHEPHNSGSQAGHQHNDSLAMYENEHSHQGHEGADPHIWLSPAHAVEIAHSMVEALVEKDLANKAVYQRNLKAFEASLRKVVMENRERLSQPVERAIFVYHDAYGHLAEFYDLPIDGVVTITPEMQPGTRHLIKLRETLSNAGKSCLFTEPQFHSPILDRLVNKLDIKLGELDPLASTVPLYPDGYMRYQEKLITTIVDCVGSTTQ